MIKIGYIIIPLWLLSSCIIQLANGTEYSSLTIEDQSKIKKIDTFIGLDSSVIYELNGNQLKSELKKHPKSLVYLFSSNCSSDFCVPLNTVIEFAKSNELKLFLVLATFYELDKTRAQDIKHQLFSVDAEYYNMNKTRNYIKAFKTDLGYYEFAKTDNYLGNFMFFDNDSLVSIKRSIIGK